MTVMCEITAWDEDGALLSAESCARLMSSTREERPYWCRWCLKGFDDRSHSRSSPETLSLPEPTRSAASFAE